jgi:inosine/xanthosine triphosphatase
MLIAVGSANPVKIAAVADVVHQVWPQATVQGVAAPSGVADQPWGHAEMQQGAFQRAQAALATLQADLGFGLEGGLVETAWGVTTMNWTVAVDRGGRVGLGTSGGVLLPDRVVAWVREGLELGEAMDRLAGAHDTKRGPGAIGILSAGLVTRTTIYASAVACALAPFLTPEFYG